MIFSISIAFIIIVVVYIVGYQHYIISKQPSYDPETTLLNYETIGYREKKLALLYLEIKLTINIKLKNYEKHTCTNRFL